MNHDNNLEYHVPAKNSRDNSDMVNAFDMQSSYYGKN